MIVGCPFPCKSRFCPSCGKVRVDEWTNAIARDLLEVPHLHLTLTIDDALRPFFHAERVLLNDLLQVAPQAVQAVLTDLYPGVRVGMIYVTHTFGRDLGFKPHVHLVMTKGGLKDDAWLEIAEVPGGRLAAKWRYLLCQRLRQRRPNNTDLQRDIAQTYIDHHGFQVYTESFYPKGIAQPQLHGYYAPMLYPLAGFVVSVLDNKCWSIDIQWYRRVMWLSS